MPKRYKEIQAQITKKYQLHYLDNPTSRSLAENIKDLSIDDIINLLKEVRDTPELTEMSISLSRRSNLFDKLVLMKGDKPHGWALRLHIYNMVGQSDEPGYVLSNLNKKIRNDENHIHEHSWQLASRFLIGGFKNHQFAKTELGPLFNRYNLVPTMKDEVSESTSFRRALLEGQTGIIETDQDLYQQGDLVHYPIEIPHKIDTRASSYLGMTITLAHTSERQHENSIFYEEIQSDQVEEVKELAIEAHKYTKKTHYEAINIAITNLELIKLCDHLAEKGFVRFNRFVDPITKKLSPNNVLETELLPTIAMLILQENEEFIEYPLTAELQGKSQKEIQKLKEKYANRSGELKKIIEDAIKDMHKPSLMQLIRTSQQNLFAKLYTASRDNLAPDVLQVVNKRDRKIPEHVLGSVGFFSHKQGVKTEASKLMEEKCISLTESFHCSYGS
ncbi:Uncharacterised protein [Legionella steigerwaltii]|uniref:Uncharacterized protein n=1 Tax=Legionella steigerwaltii TaxID=460 RepID=A0A378L7I9_9GAMM|nr:hypothetical protein [Legionella steigerwaltii]KTD77458.1 hypothetical protein Lstg_1815 [Legionella steigerwaltii]STY22687.1 Uncharacterised protein [Legionella steigerwaltii]